MAAGHKVVGPVTPGRAAHSASAKAFRTGNPEHHRQAAELHNKANTFARNEAAKAKAEGKADTSQHWDSRAMDHRDKEVEHNAKAGPAPKSKPESKGAKLKAFAESSPEAKHKAYLKATSSTPEQKAKAQSAMQKMGVAGPGKSSGHAGADPLHKMPTASGHLQKSVKDLKPGDHHVTGMGGEAQVVKSVRPTHKGYHRIDYEQGEHNILHGTHPVSVKPSGGSGEQPHKGLNAGSEHLAKAAHHEKLAAANKKAGAPEIAAMHTASQHRALAEHHKELGDHDQAAHHTAEMGKAHAAHEAAVQKLKKPVGSQPKRGPAAPIQTSAKGAKFYVNKHGEKVYVK